MAKIERESITKDKLIICEGRDEENFLISWLNSDELSNKSGFSNEIQVKNFSGNSDLSRQLAFPIINKIFVQYPCAR